MSLEHSTCWTRTHRRASSRQPSNQWCTPSWKPADPKGTSQKKRREKKLSNIRVSRNLLTLWTGRGDGCQLDCTGWRRRCQRDGGNGFLRRHERAAQTHLGTGTRTQEGQPERPRILLHPHGSAESTSVPAVPSVR